MEELVFKALQENRKFTTIESFISFIVERNSKSEVTYESIKESILRLVIYRFIKVEHDSKESCIVKESNFYQAEALGGVRSWLSKKRELSLS